MNILYFVPYVPDLVRVRPFNLIKNLSARGNHVSVASVWSTEAEKIALDGLSVVCDNVYSQKLNKYQSLINCAITIPSYMPLQASYSWHSGFARLLGELITSNQSQFDVIHIEHLRGVRYALYLKSVLNRHAFDSPHIIPVVWDSVDCISLLFKQAAIKSQDLVSRITTGFEKKRTYHYENWLIKQFDLVTVTSPVDKNEFLSMQKNITEMPEISVIPNGVDLEYFSPLSNEEREPATLVLSGKMSYHANVSMALHLVNEIMPIVWSQKPEVKLWIVGKDPPERIKKLGQNPAIKITGTVKDIRPFLQNATIAVAPITYGTGIQNKVLEAMACATPVIASSQAVSALSVVSDKDLVVANDPEWFARAVLELLADPKRRNKMGEEGRKYVEHFHNWSEIGARFEFKYREVIGRKHKKLAES